MELLEVHLWDEMIGVLAWDANQKSSFFEFNKKFLANALEPSPIIHPKSSNIIKAKEEETATALSFDTDKALPLFIADSMPDQFGTQLFSSYLERKGKNYRNLSPLEKLSYIGKRGMGALEYKPSINTKAQNNSLSIKQLQQFSNSLINKRPIANLDNMANLFHIGTSAGGAQPKILININASSGDIFRGDLLPNDEEDAWILKYNRDIGLATDADRGKIEYAYYLMAQEAGILVMESKLLEIAGEFYFMTKRFDRQNGEKIHTQTLHAFAGMNYRLPNTYSYEQVFALVNRIKLDYPAKEQLFRLMCFNCMGRNVDDHTKNFGFNMNQGGEWNFSPAYDLTFTYNENYNRPTPHFLSINGKNQDFELEDLLSVASNYSIKNPKRIIQQISTAFSKWEDIAIELKMKDRDQENGE